jgi:hypothetical protein
VPPEYATRKVTGYEVAAIWETSFKRGPRLGPDEYESLAGRINLARPYRYELQPDEQIQIAAQARELRRHLREFLARGDFKISGPHVADVRALPRALELAVMGLDRRWVYLPHVRAPAWSNFAVQVWELACGELEARGRRRSFSPNSRAVQFAARICIATGFVDGDEDDREQLIENMARNIAGQVKESTRRA